MRQIAQHRITLLILGLVLASLLGIRVLLDAFSVDQSSTLEQMLTPADVAALNEFRALFQIESEPVLLALESPSGMSLNRLAGVEQALVAVRGVAGSLSSASVERLGFSDTEIFKLGDGSELLLLFLAPESQQLEAARALSVDIEGALAEVLQEEERATVAGMPQVRTASWQITAVDARFMVPLLVSVTVLVAFLFFRSWTALGLSLLLTSLTTFACLLLQYLWQAEIKALVVFIVPVIWAIATLDAFHLYSRTALEQRRGSSEPARAAARALFLPCLLTTLTTAGCFATLTFLDTSPLIVSFGTWGAAGAVIAFALTFTLGVRVMEQQGDWRSLPVWPSLCAMAVVRAAERWSSAVVVAWLLLVLAAFSALPNLSVATMFPQVFTPEHNIARDIERLRELTGSDLNAIDLVITPTDVHGEALERLASAALFTSHYLTTIEETRHVLPTGLMSRDDINGVLERWSDGVATRYAFNEEVREGLANWVNEASGAVRLQWYLEGTTFVRKQEIMAWVANFDEDALTHHRITLSGAGFYHHLTEERGLRSLASSSLLSALLIALTLLWITRRAGSALAALCGSVVPAFVLAGAMGFSGVPWSIAMLPMPALLLGLVNDDTIHMAWGAGRRRKWRRNALEAGPALMATTCVLAGAIGTMALSGIQTNVYLGVLIPVGLVLALACNLTLLPALSSWPRRSSRSTG